MGKDTGPAIGWYVNHFQDRRWFPFNEKQMARAEQWFQRYGYWSLLLAWAPVGGDAITFIGGIMRVRIGLFVLLVGLGKGLRYAVIIFAFDAIPQ